MKNETYNRILKLHEIFQSLHDNMEVLDFLVIDLFSEKFNYSNNVFLMWLWKTTMSAQLISFYHILHPKESHSLQKIHNSLLNSGVKLDYVKLAEIINTLSNEYSTKKFEIVRSKFLAHKDIEPEQIKTDMRSVINLTKSLIDTHRFLCAELEISCPLFDSKVKLDMREIFSEINEYKNLKTYLNFEKASGKTTFTFDDMIRLSTL